MVDLAMRSVRTLLCALFFGALATAAEQCNVEQVCSNLVVEVFPNGYTTGGKNVTLFPGDCAGTDDIGVILSPHIQCGDGGNGRTGFCYAFNERGVRVTSCNDLVAGQRLFLVPQNRLFVFAPHSVGHKVVLDHVRGAGDRPIVLETINESPRVFHIHNFFSEAEATALVDFALNEQNEEMKLKRSSTGTQGYHVNRLRTSENAFDTSSPTSRELQARGFELLGIRPYDETFADGIQVLRYNVSKAYISHMDWIEPPANSEHNWDSAGTGANRFATILLYLSDVEEGGETVFPNASPGSDHPYPDFLGMSDADAKTKLESEGMLEDLPVNGWERDMVVHCRTRLSVRPKKASAILFYSQHPNGKPDQASLHGGCPVLKGQKWAANLWVWNGPRAGYTSSNGVIRPTLATFESLDVQGATLYWEQTSWGELVPGQPISANTYKGHRWIVKQGEKTVAEWVVGDEQNPRFVLRASDL